jgi:hypothetical protein
MLCPSFPLATSSPPSGCFIFHYLERAFRPRTAVPADAVEGVVAGGAGAAAGGDIEAGSHGHSHAHGGHAHSHGGSFHSGTAKRPLGKVREAGMCSINQAVTRAWPGTHALCLLLPLLTTSGVHEDAHD